MAKTKRNIGQEILDGLRRIKRGEHGRVANVPSVTRVREQTDRTVLVQLRQRRRPHEAIVVLAMRAAANPSAPALMLPILRRRPQPRLMGSGW